MKKALFFILIALLTMTLCVGLVSCGGSDEKTDGGENGGNGGAASKNLTIEQFTTAMKGVDEFFELRNMGGHYLYENDGYSSYRCKVYVDADDYIKQIEINCDDIPERKVTYAEDILRSVNEPTTGEDERVKAAFTRLKCLLKQINTKASKMSDEDFAKLMSMEVEPETYGAWKLEVYHSLDGVQFIAQRSEAE